MINNIYESIIEFKKQQGCSLPDTKTTRHFANKLFQILFICTSHSDNNIYEIQAQLKKLELELESILIAVNQLQNNSKTVAHQFFDALPQLFQKLLLDLKSIFNCDPAAKFLDEVIVAYPGFFAIAIHRFANKLFELEVPFIPRILSEYAHSKTGIDIHPAATIGDSFAIDHGTGIVIGETTTIGNNVKLYQGVTLGALSVEKIKASEKRHPTIENDVIIYAGATILGGNTTIGHNSIIGGNTWITSSIVPFSVVYHKPVVIIQDKKSFTEPLNYFI